MREIMQGRQPETTSEELEPRAVAYFSTIAAPNQTPPYPARMQREMLTLSHIVDAIARGQPHRAADLACQRIKSLDYAHQHGEWKSSGLVEVVPSDGNTLMSLGEREVVARHQRNELRLRPADQHYE
jgi:hypothetical protein